MAKSAAAARGKHTREVILDAASALFIRQGFAATSMRDIALKSQIALGGIYNHFSSKEAIFKTIVEERHPFLEIVPLLNAVEGDDTETFVRNAAHALVHQLGRHPAFLNLMLIEIVEFEGRHVPMLIGKFLPLLTSLSARLEPERAGASEISPLVLARAFLGMFFSYYITDRLLGSSMPAAMRRHAIDRFVDIFLFGVLKEAQS
jgi:AcrR family transcriptional regulator